MSYAPGFDRPDVISVPGVLGFHDPSALYPSAGVPLPGCSVSSFSCPMSPISLYTEYLFSWRGAALCILSGRILGLLYAARVTPCWLLFLFRYVFYVF